MTKNRKILLVSNGFYPEISPRSFRATELAKEFVRQGHHVAVYTKFRDFDYSDFLKEHPMDFHMWSPDRFPKPPQWKGRVGSLLSRGLTRMLSLLFEYPGIEDMFKVKRLLKKESGYDLMISFAVPFPVHWGVACRRSKRHPIANKWIADCGDPYMGCGTDNFKKPFYFKYIEKWFFRKTDIITIPVESAMNAYYPEFHQKIQIIPQGFAFDKLDIPELIKNEVYPTFAYAGGFIPGIRDPRAFLDYLATVKETFRFIVYTNSPHLIEPYQLKLGNKLELRNYVPRTTLLRNLAHMDFLVNFDNNTNLQMPSKLIDYALTKRPVLNITGNLDEETIEEFLNGNYVNQLKLNDVEKYNIKNIASKFLAIIND